jgi:hypothetical protein
MAKRAYDIGSAAADRDAHHHVARRQADRVEICGTCRLVVLCRLDRTAQCGVSARDDTDDHLRRHREGGRAFRGIEHAEPPARARPDIDKPPTRLER